MLPQKCKVYDKIPHLNLPPPYSDDDMSLDMQVEDLSVALNEDFQAEEFWYQAFYDDVLLDRSYDKWMAYYANDLSRIHQIRGSWSYVEHIAV